MVWKRNKIEFTNVRSAECELQPSQKWGGAKSERQVSRESKLLSRFFISPNFSIAFDLTPH